MSFLRLRQDSARSRFRFYRVCYILCPDLEATVSLSFSPCPTFLLLRICKYFYYLKIRLDFIAKTENQMTRKKISFLTGFRCNKLNYDEFLMT